MYLNPKYIHIMENVNWIADHAIQSQNHNFAHICRHKIIQLTDMFQFLNAL